MHIFIDESGTFALTDKPTSVSAIGAVVLPDYAMKGFDKLYSRVRRRLPKVRGEVKGRLLSEAEVCEVAEVVRKVGGLFEVVLIDMGLHSREVVEEHRAKQAEAVTHHLTDEHHPNLVQEVWELRRNLEAMPLQLYVQAVSMTSLVFKTLNLMQTYFALRRPSEIARYHWVIDAKHRDGFGPDPWEEWWRITVMPMLESSTFREPFRRVEGGDYSPMERFRVKPDEYKTQFISPGPRDDFFDIRLVMQEDFRFSSTAEPGLEVADILVNAMRRSLSGNFSREGWMALPPLMIHRRPHCFSMVSLMPQDDHGVDLPYERVLRDFVRGGRTMLLRRIDKTQRRQAKSLTTEESEIRGAG